MISDGRHKGRQETSTARVVQTHKIFIHILRLREYEESIEQMEESLRLVQEDAETRDLVKILQKKLRYIGGKLKMVVPRKINKTGLINALGSVIKAIRGNLDAEKQEIRKKREEER